MPKDEKPWGAGKERERAPSAKSIEARKRETQVLEMRADGMSSVDIATELGLSRPRVTQLITRAMSRGHSAAREMVRDLELRRLDDMMVPHLSMALGEVLDSTYDDQYKAGNLVLRIMERRAKYIGLDAPQQMEVTYAAVVAHVNGLRTELARERAIALGGAADGNGNGAVDAESVSVQSDNVGQDSD